MTQKKSHGKKQVHKTGVVCSRHVTFALFFLVIAVASAFIVKPFFTTIVISAILAYILTPAYQGFLMMFKRKAPAAGVVVLLLLLLLLFPTILLASTVTKESINAYQYVKEQTSEGGFASYCKDPENFGCSVYLPIADWSADHEINIADHMKEGALSVAAGLVKKASNIVLNLPSIFLQLFFILFFTYYFLKEGSQWLDKAKQTLPLDQNVKDKIIRRFNDVVHATLYGAVVMSIIQGVIAGIGYFIFGAPIPLLFGFLTIIASFIPFVGASLVWVPLVLYMLVAAISTGSTILIYKSIGLFLFGIFIISTIDNILKPKIVGDRAGMHPLIILIGVFGGLAVFGLVGILVGPMVLVMFITSLKLYEQEKKHIKL